MKQLDLFDCYCKGNEKGGKAKATPPTFDTWYAENSHERRQYGEKPYQKNRAIRIYRNLVDKGFFDNYEGGE
tara:strand:+ start:265 stop:480 length:216 start_codon:yes stop_codon:yes gene_type:complete